MVPPFPVACEQRAVWRRNESGKIRSASIRAGLNNRFKIKTSFHGSALMGQTTDGDTRVADPRITAKEVKKAGLAECE
jgi:hypothetical protein